MRLFIRKQIVLLLVDIAIYYFCGVFFLLFFCLFAHASIIRLASLKPFVSFIHLIPFSFEEHSSSLYRARVRRKLPLRKYRNIWCICHFPSLPLYFHRLFLFVTKNSRVREKMRLIIKNDVCTMYLAGRPAKWLIYFANSRSVFYIWRQIWRNGIG